MRSSHALLCATGVLLAACSTKPLQQSDMHIQQTPDTVARSSGTIPQPSKQAVVLPPPQAAAKVETYSVVVTNLPAREILFALARDAKINIDIHSGIDGVVTLNAINQTLPQILDRISKQVDMRYELKDGLLVVMPDTPFLKSYKIDYVNMARDAEGGISNTSQVGGGGAGGASSGGANNSQLSIKNSSKNHFWDTLVKNITDILRETDKVLPQGSSEVIVQQQNTQSQKGDSAAANADNAAVVEGEGTTVTRRSTFREAASVIPNPEAGIITVRATGKQHEKIHELITRVMQNARRQVLIEVTVAEVALSNSYQQGINWSKLLAAGSSKGFSVGQAPGTGVLPTTTGLSSGTFVLNYANPSSKFGAIAASVSLLESFGDVKVLSSPKLSVMNNQTAVLRIVNNLIYFLVSVTPGTAATATSPAVAPTYNTSPQTVPVGFTMSVTPQISENDSVQINLRPTITRLVRYVPDPNPGLLVGGVSLNQIPETQTREMESILKIDSNQIAVLGGLMQDDITNQTDEVPLLSKIPFFGAAFKNRSDKSTKTELVIFLRPVVIKDGSLDGDYSEFRDSLPTSDFLKPESKKE
ncbi:MAG: type II and III secretion system protein [Gammaproteobacteria bacterium]|nr:type II and III secretion system protein [Gammaproteobacteria bacterium]MBU1624888.1 type II and III secretion system protein [Gammaproteobacteria bacterium]MBU1982732.1 type II and III secretion system protein [Gammaproteobacteria bacterium]